MDSLLCGKVDTFSYHFTDLYIYLFNTDDVHRLSVAAAAGKRYVLQTLGDEAILVLNLEYLGLGNNKLDSYPYRSLYCKTKLWIRAFELKNCELTTIPDNVLDFVPSLDRLDLSFNRLTTIHNVHFRAENRLGSWLFLKWRHCIFKIIILTTSTSKKSTIAQHSFKYLWKQHN